MATVRRRQSPVHLTPFFCMHDPGMLSTVKGRLVSRLGVDKTSPGRMSGHRSREPGSSHGVTFLTVEHDDSV